MTMLMLPVVVSVVPARHVFDKGGKANIILGSQPAMQFIARFDLQLNSRSKVNGRCRFVSARFIDVNSLVKRTAEFFAAPLANVTDRQKRDSTRCVCLTKQSFPPDR